jgi:hypothetical protein
MRDRPTLRRLYLLNAAVLITHEIDSAYWHEWDLFGLPGGIQVFLGLNFVIVLLILYGYQALIMGRGSGLFFAWLLAAGGLFAAGAHALFIYRGSEAFTLPASLGLLAATLVLSLWQVAALIRPGGRARRL